MSIAEQAMILEQAQVQIELNAATLSTALDVQEEIVAELLESLGIGQNLDITA
jgi:hypothetical protein